MLSHQNETFTILSLSLETLKHRKCSSGSQAAHEWQNDVPIKHKLTHERGEPIQSCVTAIEALESKERLDPVPGEAVGDRWA